MVSFVCDSGNKYLSKMYNDYWMVDQGFIERESHGDLRDIINPATEQSVGQVAFGNAADVDKAVRAARAAFESFSQWSVGERIALLERIVDGLKARNEDIAQAISDEMGAPIQLARTAQAGSQMTRWILLRDDLVDSKAEDPVQRQPTRVTAAAVFDNLDHLRLLVQND